MCLFINVLLLSSFFYMLLAYALRWFERSNRAEFIAQHGERTIYNIGFRPVLYFLLEYVYVMLHLIMLALDYLAWPLQRLYHKKDVSHPDSLQRPIVLVHGYMMRGGVMWLIKRRLINAGFKQVHLFTYAPPWRDINCFARQLEDFVSKIAPDPKTKVDIVAHSMGGLVSRYYINLLEGYKRVSRFITLGTPHGGSMLWSFAIWQCGRQMRPESPTLNGLAENDYRLDDLSVTSIYSDFDELVIPQESPVISRSGVNNIMVSGVGHVGFVFDGYVYELIEQALRKY